MENIFKRSKEKIEEFAFGKEGVNGLYREEYKKMNNDMKKISLISGIVFFVSLIVECIIQTSELKIVGFIEMIAVFAGIISFFSSLCFLTCFSTFISGLFFLEKTYEIDKNEIKTKKLKKTILSLKELEEISPLLTKIKESLSEEEFFDIMKAVEIKTKEKLGSAYYFLYLIDNYEILINEIKEKPQSDINFKTQLSSLTNFNKESPL